MPGYAVPISQGPSPDAAARRATRVLATVLELHKAGYQRLRVVPGHSLDGNHWRVFLLPASRVHNDGWTPVSLDGALMYSTEHSDEFFHLPHTASDNARALAAKLLMQYPELARESAGDDWIYSGWLVEMLGRAEHGQLPALFGSYAFDHGLTHTPLPPVAPADLQARLYVGTGCRMISYAELTLADLPSSGAVYEDLWEFCLSFDAGRAAQLENVELVEVAQQTRHKWSDASMEALRMTAYYYQRAIKWSSQWPPSDDYLYTIRSAIEEMRRRLTR